MSRRWRIRLLIAAMVVPLLALAFDGAQIIYWVGSTDLEIEFAVTDAATGLPLNGAQVEVQSDGGFYAEDYRQEFTLAADADGSARKVCPSCMCFGTQSGLRFTDTFAVHLPRWVYRAVADGYETPVWADLNVPKVQRQVQRAGPRRATLVVPVSLHKKGSVEPGP